MLPNVGEKDSCMYLKGGNGRNTIAMSLVKLKIDSAKQGRI